MSKIAEFKALREFLAFDKELTEYRARVRDGRRKAKVKRFQSQIRKLIDHYLDVLDPS